MSISKKQFISKCARLGWKVNVRPTSDQNYMDLEIETKNATLLTGTGTGILDSEEDFKDWVQQVRWDNNI